MKWVTERHSCSASAIFEQLRRDVEQDVEERNSLRKASPEFGVSYGFKFIPTSAGFSVVRDGIAKEGMHTAIAFFLKGEQISIKDANNTELLSATVTLNDEGQCKFKVGKEELESWHIRKRALERIFFEGI